MSFAKSQRVHLADKPPCLPILTNSTRNTEDKYRHTDLKFTNIDFNNQGSCDPLLLIIQSLEGERTRGGEQHVTHPSLQMTHSNINTQIHE